MKIKIKLPETPALHQFETSIRITDLNYGNHLGNDSVLSLIHEARCQTLAHYGHSELKMNDHSLIMRNSAIEYKSQGFFNDQLKISVYADEFTQMGHHLYYQIENMTSGRVLALGFTAMVYFDYENQKTYRHQYPEYNPYVKS